MDPRNINLDVCKSVAQSMAREWYPANPKAKFAYIETYGYLQPLDVEANKGLIDIRMDLGLLKASGPWHKDIRAYKHPGTPRNIYFAVLQAFPKKDSIDIDRTRLCLVVAEVRK